MSFLMSAATFSVAGYYSRFAVLRSLLIQFLEVTKSYAGVRQILVLGAGYDTSFFQLKKDLLLPTDVSFIELDFIDVTTRKAAAIAHFTQLKEFVSDDAVIDLDKGEVTSSRAGYFLRAVDLRDIAQVQAALQSIPNINLDAPTFILSECVLVYLQPQDGNNLLSFLSKTCTNAAIAIYEQVNPNDAFGKQMMLNLSIRGCPLLGIMPNLESHKQRLLKTGWRNVDIKSMGDLYQSCIDPLERRRIERLELLDEFEEWNLIQEHYSVAIGVTSIENGLDAWGFPVKANTGAGQGASDPRLQVLSALKAQGRSVAM